MDEHNEDNVEHLERWMKGGKRAPHPSTGDLDPQEMAPQGGAMVKAPTKRQKDKLRQRRAMELRMQGSMSWEEIAKKAGYSSGSAAARAVGRAMDGVPVLPEIDKHRRLQLARTEYFLSQLWPRIEEGQPNAIQKALALMEYQDRVVEGRTLDPAPGGANITITASSPFAQALAEIQEAEIVE